ncbi:MAG: cell division ATP-binding protein FtsE [Rhodospirillaceae bacterium]|nr:cell division ATP-binding protein FtsE [Rhodospirillaceae bacterium]
MTQLNVERPVLVLRFEDVEMRYTIGPPVLHGVHFELDPNSFHFMTGKSGAGKSSLLRMIYLALLPSRGRVVLFGRDTRTLSRDEISRVRRRIGIVFQDFRLIEHLNVRENVALPLRIAGTRESVIRRHVPELLDWVGLAEHLNALPRTLSGGQQQRVAIARAVIAQPTLLLADEPTGNVDDRIAHRLLYLFEELHRAGTTVIVATHNDALVSRFPHARLHLEEGHLKRLEGSRKPNARTRQSLNQNDTQ